MRKIVLFGILVFIVTGVNAQTWLSENFDNSTFPPEGWTIDGNAENWKYTGTNYAGGTTGEARLLTLPVFEGTTRFVSPEIDITGSINLSIYFKHTLRLYQGGLIIGIATRTGSEDWTSAWEMDGTTTTKAEVDIVLDNQGSASDFQFCFYFTGESAKIKYWAIDDIMLYTKNEHDIATKSIITESYFAPDDEFTAVAKVYNNGFNVESFDILCSIFDTGNNLLFSNTQTVNELNAGEYSEITFDPFQLPGTPDEAWHIVVSAGLDGDMTPENDTAETYIYTYVTHPHEMVVVEIGTATWCSACPYAAKAADSIVKNGYNLAIIEYHTDDDYSSTATDNRVLDYYSMYGFPTAMFDGVEEQVGAGPNFYSNYFSHYYFRSLEKTGTAVSLSSGKTKEGYNIQVTVSKLAPAYNKHAVVHLILTESHIEENWQGEDELNFVCRLMLPDENGTKIDLGEIDEITLDYTIDIDTSWNYDELEVVAFVQDNDSHEILNATKSGLSELIGINKNVNPVILKLSNNPNPFSTSTNIFFELLDESEVNLEVVDLTGKTVTQLIKGNIEKGKHQIVWKPESSLPGGIYFIKLIAGQYIEVIKAIKTK
jgi:thiol-disulfide isomerase/thioredoxin